MQKKQESFIFQQPCARIVSKVLHMSVHFMVLKGICHQSKAFFGSKIGFSRLIFINTFKQ